MNTTTGARPTRTSWKKILVGSLLLQALFLAVLWWCEPLRVKTLSFHPNEAEAVAEQAKKRNLLRKELEMKRRNATRLPEASVQALLEREKEVRKRKLTDKLAELRDISEEMRAMREERLELVKDRNLEDINRLFTHRLVQRADAVVTTARILKERTPLSLGDETYRNALLLQRDTVAFLEDMSAANAEELEGLGSGMETAVVHERHRIQSSSEAEQQTVGLFLLDGEDVLKKVRAYLLHLESFVFDEEALKAFQDISAAPPPDLVSEPPLEEIPLEGILEEISAQEHAIAKEFAVMRAAELAKIQNRTLADALAVVNSALGDSMASPSGGSPTPGEAQGNAAQGNAEGQGTPSAGGAGAQGVQTVGDLNTLRGQLDAQVQAANQSWVRSLNAAAQAGALGTAGSQGLSADSFQTPSSSGGTSTSQGEGGGGRSGGLGGGDLEGENATRAYRGQKGYRIQISPEIVKAKALPGRRFWKGSDRQGWLYLDSWYIVGPWENHGKLAYDHVHPPEISIDLDATYSDGKEHKIRGKGRYPLRWQFIQSDTMRISPPQEDSDSTYYAYTEVYLEEGMDMLVAIASDDAARVWVNDRLIWEDNGLSGWTLDEGFRRVRFETGFNKVLVRLENGIKICEFSVLLCPPDQVDAL